MVIQEKIYIKKIIEVYCFFKNGKLLSNFMECCNKNDIYNPLANSTLFYDERLINFCKELGKKTKYDGFIDIEFFWDEINNLFYLIEINCRIGGIFIYYLTYDMKNIINIFNNNFENEDLNHLYYIKNTKFHHVYFFINNYYKINWKKLLKKN